MLFLNFDGSCVTNPGGPGGWGWLLCQRTGEKIASASGHLPAHPDLTVNSAEFVALIEGLRFLAARPDITGPVVVRGDSKLVIQLISGRWGARKANMARLTREALNWAHRIGCERLSYRWVPRAQNDACDRLSKGYRQDNPDPICSRPEGVQDMAILVNQVLTWGIDRDKIGHAIVSAEKRSDGFGWPVTLCRSMFSWLDGSDGVPGRVCRRCRKALKSAKVVVVDAADETATGSLSRGRTDG